MPAQMQRRRALVGLATTTALALAFSTPAAMAQPDDASGVAAAVEQLRSLMLKPDAAALQALLHEQLTYGHSAGKVDNKTSLTQALMTGTSAFARIDLSAQTVAVAGQVAHVRHVFDSDITPAGKPPSKVHLQVLTVWLRGAAGWQLLARQAVPLPLP